MATTFNQMVTQAMAEVPVIDAVEAHPPVHEHGAAGEVDRQELYALEPERVDGGRKPGLVDDAHVSDSAGQADEDVHHRRI